MNASGEPTPLSAEHVSPETWKLLQNAFPAYQDEQLDFVIGLERFQRSALTKLAHWVNPDPECDHCYAAWAQWASEGDGPFTFAQIAYWNTSEVTSGFERRLFATIDAQATEIAALKEALEELRQVYHHVVHRGELDECELLLCQRARRVLAGKDVGDEPKP